MRRVAVVGSGAAGLCAALAAANGGAQVTVYESHQKLGGTTALSGGNAWMPAHAGIPDDTPELALTYLRALALGDVNEELLDVFVRESGPTAARIERDTRIRLQPIPYCDYHAEYEGGREQGGRTLEPQPYDAPDGIKAMIRDAPNVAGPITYQELATGEYDREQIARRRERGTLTLGRALIAGLLEACLDAGVQIRAGERLRALPDADAVVLATGGFERDEALAKAFLRGPMVAPVGAPTAQGDGLRMAMAAGADLGLMSEAWWCPSITIPGETIDGQQMHRLILTERARAGSLIVNTAGRRFGNEAQNYNDFGRTLHDFDAPGFAFRNVPAWLIFGAEYRSRYRIGPLSKRDPDPEWLPRADSLEGLAELIGVPADALAESVSRFDEDAADGEDPQFGRGTYPYDRFIGEIGPVGAGPYYALRIVPGCLGTKGGPRIDAHGRVLSVADGAPIPGLYAAGNAAASPLGLAYPGAGGTLGGVMVFGLRAGDAAAADAAAPRPAAGAGAAR
jgi:3-oxosteroid 1-dehydrogenase